MAQRAVFSPFLVLHALFIAARRADAVHEMSETRHAASCQLF
jgi:hypothetical protein